MTCLETRRLAAAVYDRIVTLHQMRFPGPGQITEEALAAMMAAETGIDVDTMKIVIRPELWLAPWSRYETVLTALEADRDTTEWFMKVRAELAEDVPAWRPPPRDIADITTAAEFMAALRRMRETPHQISVNALAHRMCSRDSENAWRRTRLGDILQADTVPPLSKYAYVRNLLAALGENAKRPAADVDHLLETWRRLQPETATLRAVAVAVLRPQPDAPAPEEPDLPVPQVVPVAPVASVEPWRPVTKAFVMLGAVLIVAFVALIALL